MWRTVTENPAIPTRAGRHYPAGGILLISTDALIFAALLCLGAMALVAVALFAPLALGLFAVAGAIGLNRQVRRWRAAGPI